MQSYDFIIKLKKLAHFRKISHEWYEFHFLKISFSRYLQFHFTYSWNLIDHITSQCCSLFLGQFLAERREGQIWWSQRPCNNIIADISLWTLFEYGLWTYITSDSHHYFCVNSSFNQGMSFGEKQLTLSWRTRFGQNPTFLQWVTCFLRGI